MLFTLLLLGALSAIFLNGFKEAIGIAVVLVGVYLVLNAIVTVKALGVVMHHPELVSHWKHTLFAQHPNWLGMLGLSLLLFQSWPWGSQGLRLGLL